MKYFYRHSKLIITQIGALFPNFCRKGLLPLQKEGADKKIPVLLIKPKLSILSSAQSHYHFSPVRDNMYGPEKKFSNIRDEFVVKSHLTKLKASTLVEVITALTIISITSGIFMAIMLKAGNYLVNRQKQYAFEQIIELINECKKGPLEDEETFNYESFTIQKEVACYQNNKHLWLVSFKAFTNENKLIIEHKSIIEYDKQE